MNKIILGFVGPIASGKGTACQYLRDRHGAPTYRFSTPLRDVLDRLYLPQARANLQNLSLGLRQTFGDDLLASVIAHDVAADQSPLIAIDGVRRPTDLTQLKDVPGFFLVSITADQQTRYDRIRVRGENTDDAAKTFEQFQQDEQAEAEKQIQDIAAAAAFTVNNNGTREQLYEQLEAILKKIHEGKD